jgi:hypothetical protein
MSISRQKLYEMGMPLGDSCTQQKAGGGYVCGGGGGGSSSSSSSTTNTQDRRAVGAQDSVTNTGDNVTINASVTDQGAIQRAFDLATSSSAAEHQTISDALGFAQANDARFMDAVAGLAKQSMDQVSAAAGKAQADVVGAYQNVADTNSGTRQLMMVGLIIVGVVASSVVFKKGS